MKRRGDILLNEELLRQNPVGFLSCCRFFDHVDKLFREVGYGDERLKFSGDFLRRVLSFAELFAQCIDFDFSEDIFEGCLPIEQDLHVGGILQISDKRGFGEHGAKYAT